MNNTNPKTTLNILIIGSGGREHAIAWKIAQSPRLNRLYALPGNPGIAQHAEIIDHISAQDHPSIIRFCQEYNINLVIIGPETYLAQGIVDSLGAAGIRCFGPSKAAAQIETSKVFSKQFMQRHGIPTAQFESFNQLNAALQYIEMVDHPLVIKASGLAAGKGVILPNTLQDARAALIEIMQGQIFGESGSEVIIEERLTGPEISLMAFCDGETVLPMLSAQDHKRLLNQDLGPNTGGMGAYAPAPIFSPDLLSEAMECVLKPAIRGLRHEGMSFTGVLYAGLMLTPNGMRVLEFNCRFGDPETQVVLPLLLTDLVEILEACVDGRLADQKISWANKSAICVILAGAGYPAKTVGGQPIYFAPLPENCACFLAGAKFSNTGQIITVGGRVMGLAAWANTLSNAAAAVYGMVGPTRFDGMQYRGDIAWGALKADSQPAHPAHPCAQEQAGRTAWHLPDDLITRLNQLAMQVYREVGPGQSAKLYQQRFADLCLHAGLAMEQDITAGHLTINILVENTVVVECRTSHYASKPADISQVLTKLASVNRPAGLLANFGPSLFQSWRIIAPGSVMERQKYAYPLPVKSPDAVLPPPAAPSHDPAPSPQASYASSGVSIDAGNQAVTLMKSAVKSTYTEAVLAGIGSFGGLFSASQIKALKQPVLVASTDGVGTKVKLAAATGRFRSIGHDIVNHCINDILVQGAQPLFFMDYFATSKLNPEQTAEVVTGIAEACKDAGMVLLGGETAEMPGVYSPHEFDVAGTIVGMVEQDQILPRISALKAGDVLIGLASSGPHTNGYSLIRQVFADTALDSMLSEQGATLADALLAPHRSYKNILLPNLKKIKALAHLTGGGFIENIPRVLPDHLDAQIQLSSWKVPELWQRIQQKGNIAVHEMYRVFNMGIGMVAIVDKEVLDEVRDSIPEKTFIIGRLVDGHQRVQLIA